MQIEQVGPNKPNFKLILALFCAALLVAFFVAIVFLHVDIRHLTPNGVGKVHNSTPNTSMQRQN